MRVFAVIMAGGVGARFWPQSRESMPKQFQEVFGPRTLYQRTFDRISTLVTPENVFVVTSASQRPVAVTQLPQIPEKNVIAEPFGRNTAPCLSAAASAISSITEDAVMVVLPSDHLISEDDVFLAQLKDAIRLADKKRALVTLGIKPTHPETGFGYIHIKKETGDAGDPEYGAYRVESFKEKPDRGTAVKFLESGDYLWNSGMFVWRVDIILEELRKNLTHFGDFRIQLRDTFGRPGFDKALEEFYLRAEAISIDYAVMEKAQGVMTIPGNFLWSDVGSWDEVYRLSDRDSEGNTLRGDVTAVNSHNNLVWADDRTFGLVDIDDLIVVETKDSVLICRRGRSQGVKAIVDTLKKNNRQDLI